MKPPRNAEIFVTIDTAKRLRFIADVNDKTCLDELAEEILVNWLTQNCPGLDAVMDKADRARRKVLDEAKETIAENKSLL